MSAGNGFNLAPVVVLASPAREKTSGLLSPAIRSITDSKNLVRPQLIGKRILTIFAAGPARREEGSMKGKDETVARDLLRDAGNHLRSALALLDRAEAPAHVGAHVDFAIHQLEHAIDTCAAESAVSN